MSAYVYACENLPHLFYSIFYTHKCELMHTITNNRSTLLSRQIQIFEDFTQQFSELQEHEKGD